MKKRIKRILFVIISAIVLTFAFTGYQIYSYRNEDSKENTDAAIVLGAAVWGKEVSPVFRERINHGVNLYKTGRVKKLIFTGGQGNPDEATEAATARQYAIQQGVKEEDILLEEKSHKTYENIYFAKQVADKNGIRKVLIVSDPLHLKRSVTMARDVGFEAYPSPTPTTLYKNFSSQSGMLADESYQYIGYILRRTFGLLPKIKE